MDPHDLRVAADPDPIAPGEGQRVAQRQLDDEAGPVVELGLVAPLRLGELEADDDPHAAGVAGTLEPTHEQPGSVRDRGWPGLARALVDHGSDPTRAASSPRPRTSLQSFHARRE